MGDIGVDAENLLEPAPTALPGPRQQTKWKAES
jgi:hypothetical protein